MSDVFMVVTDDNNPLVVFSTDADAQRYVTIQAHGSLLMPARTDLHVVPLSVWRSFDKLTAAMQKIDASWGQA